MAAKVDLSTSVAGISLSTCLYNASGPRSGTSAALHKVAASQSGAVLTKSATLLAQKGNPQPRTWHSEDGLASLNSEGLPNNGIAYYIDTEIYNDSMQGIVKPYIVSLSGKTLADNLAMLDQIAKSPTLPHISAIELNLACPNVIGKPIIAYDFTQMDAILTAVAQVAHNLPPIGVKLPPYLDFMHFQMAADVLNKHKKTVRYVATINTIGNATAIDLHSAAPYISSNDGFAGLSGPCVKYTALANVRRLRQLLSAEVDVVGVGGIRTGGDVLEFLLAGAVACQIATTHWAEGPGAFDRILAELRECMVQYGYQSVSRDVCGKLKGWTREGAALSRQAQKKVVPRGTTQQGDGSHFYKLLSAFLVVVIAILLSDKLM